LFLCRAFLQPFETKISKAYFFPSIELSKAALIVEVILANANAFMVDKMEILPIVFSQQIYLLNARFLSLDISLFCSCFDTEPCWSF